MNISYREKITHAAANKAPVTFARRIEQPFVVLNRAGMHARPSALLVYALKNIKSEVVVIKKGHSAYNAKSIMSMIAMGAVYGDELLFTAEGEDAAEAIRIIADLFAKKFEEE